MRLILEIKYDKSIDLIYHKGGFLRKESFANLSSLDINLIKNKEIVLVLPDSFLITKSLSLPIEIKNIVSIKSFLMKSLPINLNELYNDYIFFGSKMYFLAIRKEVVDDFLSLIKRVKGKVISALPKSFIFKLAYNLNSNKLIGFNFDSFYTSVFCYEGNAYFFFAVLPYGYNSKFDDELSITKFINELYRIVSSFQGQTKINIEGFYFFVDKQYKDLPVLGYLSKTFPGISFITMDDGKYLDLYYKIIDYKEKFPINLSIDKINNESQKELLLLKADNLLNVTTLLLIVIFFLILFLNSDKLNREVSILEGLKSNYQSSLNSFRNSQVSLKIEGNTSLLKVFQVINTLSEEVSNQIYLENFNLVDKTITLTLISPKYSDVYLLNSKLNQAGINSILESNTKFSIDESFQYNKSQMKVKW